MGTLGYLLNPFSQTSINKIRRLFSLASSKVQQQKKKKKALTLNVFWPFLLLLALVFPAVTRSDANCMYIFSAILCSLVFQHLCEVF